MHNALLLALKLHALPLQALCPAPWVDQPVAEVRYKGPGTKKGDMSQYDPLGPKGLREWPARDLDADRWDEIQPVAKPVKW